MRRNATERRRRSGRRGFSIIELLVVVAVTSVGFVALLDLQVSSIRGLTYPANLTAAINLGEQFLATLHVEAIEWTGQGNQSWNNPNLRYLSTLNEAVASDAPEAWRVAAGADDAPDLFRDQAGSDQWYDAGLLREIDPRQNPRFCLHYRLVWANQSQRVMRADVRVLWLRDDAAFTQFSDCRIEMAEARFRGQVQSLTLTDQILINTSI